MSRVWEQESQRGRQRAAAGEGRFIQGEGGRKAMNQITDVLVFCWAGLLICLFLGVMAWLGYLLFDDWRVRRAIREAGKEAIRRLQAGEGAPPPPPPVAPGRGSLSAG